MITFSKGIKKGDHGLVTVALFRCWRPFGKSYWYCRFMVEQDRSRYYFYAAEHTNKFTAYRKALKKATLRIDSEL